MGGDQDLVDLVASGTDFGRLNFTVETGGVEMTMTGEAGFSVVFKSYTDTANFAADDFLFV